MRWRLSERDVAEPKQDVRDEVEGNAAAKRDCGNVEWFAQSTSVFFTPTATRMIPAIIGRCR